MINKKWKIRRPAVCRLLTAYCFTIPRLRFTICPPRRLALLIAPAISTHRVGRFIHNCPTALRRLAGLCSLFYGFSALPPHLDRSPLLGGSLPCDPWRRNAHETHQRDSRCLYDHHRRLNDHHLQRTHHCRVHCLWRSFHQTTWRSFNSAWRRDSYFRPWCRFTLGFLLSPQLTLRNSRRAFLVNREARGGWGLCAGLQRKADFRLIADCSSFIIDYFLTSYFSLQGGRHFLCKAQCVSPQ